MQITYYSYFAFTSQIIQTDAYVEIALYN
ncbi:protein of unknown function [Lactobacillus delbrueckii subsp. delbrueckii]|uniref:Uncharacterized protein n=1 Tax=Lactobacillus delbrueckii subsp. delbrueckii TaxID=83684 RepID=A0AAU9R784_9LACO|nr:protein of unknown function [Lactobacillus delbrueckii subsp. delbrueckii]